MEPPPTTDTGTWALAWLVELAFAAVLLFWGVGAYNRLMSLRNALGAAWARIEDLLNERSALLAQLLELLQQPLADEATTLKALAAAQQRQTEAAVAARAKPADAEAIAAWAAAEMALASPLARLLALIEQRAELMRDAAIVPLHARWPDLKARLAYERQGYNQAAALYNEAITQFPTRLLARAFSFRRAGMV